MREQERVAAVVRQLRLQYPDADCTLVFEKPWQLMIAAILAAQCTDARVNRITADLFLKYPDLRSFADADQEELEQDIRSCGLFRNKARAIKASCLKLLERYDGQMPGRLENLLELPGIGRKIANLILGDFFRVPAVVVDTHCARITFLLGFTRSRNPAVVERDLTRILPEAYWISWGHLMVAHGRAICHAKQPLCPQCPVRAWCDFACGSENPLSVAENFKDNGSR